MAHEHIEWMAKILLLVDRTYTWIGHKYGEGRLYGSLNVEGVSTELDAPRLSAFFGQKPAEGTRSPALAREKIARLRAQPDYHQSSWLSRNPAEAQYAGAIRLPETAAPLGFMAWSGFPELTDEAYMLAVAVRVGLMNREEALVIAKISANPYFEIMVRDLYEVPMF